MSIDKEQQFEDEVCAHLEQHGWLYSPTADGYDRARALFPADVFAWLEATQSHELAKVVKPDAALAAQEKARTRILDRIAKVRSTDPVNGGGTLSTLRASVDVTPAKLRLFQGKPSIGFNEQLRENYAANRLRVMRQVSYSSRTGNRLDLVLFLNGIPVATVELKTDLTQSADAALKQYAHDRPPAGEPLLEFGRGALVHFVVSNELIFMTTKLDGVNTRFLPFNRGADGGKGNPPIEGTSPTAYFWQETLQRDTWLDLIGRFLHYRIDTKSDALSGKSEKVASLRFPRYHQWRAVTALMAAAREEGPGNSYLIQHSAGSGKTDSIAWTAHRLASLHRDDGSKVFDGVIVVSDRTVLDGQLQRAVEQLEAKAGVFEAITKGGDEAKSKRLAQALTDRKQIIGVTLQTFPFALEHLEQSEGLRDRTYAVIADEAHSSQSGDAAATLKLALTGRAADDPDAPIDAEDVLADRMARRAQPASVSFFAFTATPKGKTLELFGRPDPATGKHVPFDLYPMKQAIEEGFILDVLRNYVSYDVAFKLAHEASADRPEEEVDVDRANKQVMRWVRLHPYNIAQKVEVIVEHFRQNVQRELGGKAKAMVVTGSRKEAVRYKLAIDRYIAERGLRGIAAMVAFSGSVNDPESGVVDGTEASLNLGLQGRSLETAFATDEYQVMIVAEKFQTGFDQPLLVGMYVDKKLSGITAVQTLSRLNRVIPGKENTYVLDFVNEPDVILEAFQTYYEDAQLAETSNPDVIHDMLAKLRAQHIIDEIEVARVAELWLEGKSHNALYGALATSRDRFWHRWRVALEIGDEHEQRLLDEFRGTVHAFVRSYDFLSQIVDYGDTSVERWAIFLRVFRRVIERDEPGADAISTDDVVLTHYRLRKLGEQSLQLSAGRPGELTGPGATGSAGVRETQLGPLQLVLDRINDLFTGTAMDDSDQVSVIETLMRRAVENEQLQTQAMANAETDFAWSPTLTEQIESILYESAAGSQSGFKHLLQLSELDRLVDVLLAAGLHAALRQRAASG